VSKRLVIEDVAQCVLEERHILRAEGVAWQMFLCLQSVPLVQLLEEFPSVAPGCLVAGLLPPDDISFVHRALGLVADPVPGHHVERARPGHGANRTRDIRHECQKGRVA